MLTEDDLKKRKLEQLRQQQIAEQQMMEEMKTQKEMKNVIKTIMLNILDRKARERLNNLRVVKPQIAAQLETYIVQLYQTGQLRSQMTDEQLKKILIALQKKREIKIRRI